MRTFILFAVAFIVIIFAVASGALSQQEQQDKYFWFGLFLGLCALLLVTQI
jgi:hypothetical protein